MADRTPDLKTEDIMIAPGVIRTKLVPVSNSPGKSPVKPNEMKTALNSPSVYEKELDFLIKHYGKPSPGVVNKLDSRSLFKSKKPRVLMVPSQIQQKPLKGSTMKNKIEYTVTYKCIICRRNNHSTENCHHRCSRPSCDDLMHHNSQCPYHVF